MLKILRYIPLTLTAVLSLTGLVSAQQTIYYTVLMMGKEAGQQTTVVRQDSAKEISFEYNDRGRGPNLRSQIKLDESGFPVLFEVKGNDYFKAAVTETMSVVSGVARWKNQAETGEKKLTGKAFYISMNSVPEDLAILAQALLKTPGGRLRLLPEGEAGIRQTGEMTLKQDGTARRVISYEIDGLDFAPITIWLDEDRGFFASVSSWTSFVRKGWESSVPDLLKTQDAMEAGRAASLARTLTRKPATALVFKNADLFDAETGKMVPYTTVVVEGDRITAVGRSSSIKIPRRAEVIDARGKTIMPGLWDMHSHMFPNQGLMHVAAGVTTIRDLGNDIETLAELKTKVEAGAEIGPRILMGGLIDGRGPFTGPTKSLVDTEDEARAAVDNFARLGYVQIKIYSSIKPELVPKIIEFAHAKGLRVSGHVPAFMSAEQFVAAGADEFQHINFFVLNFLFDDVKDTRTPLRFTAVADRAAELDLSSERVRSFVKVLADKKIVVDPTINVFESIFTNRPGVMSVGFAPVADRLPAQIRRSLFTGGLPVPEGKDQRYRDSAQALLRMIKMLYDAGVPLVAGTDSLAGFSLHRELELYVEAGIPAAYVLRIATINSARVMKKDKELGSIVPGKLADLILVDGNPATRISDIRRVSMVVKGGNVYDPRAMYQSIGVRP